MQAANEHVLYRQDETTVTDRQVIHRQKTIDLNKIQSVSLIPPVLKRWYGSVALAIGVVLLIVGYIVWNGVLLSPMIGGIALVIIGVAILFTGRNYYLVRLSSVGRDAETLQVADETQAHAIASAISAAIEQH